MPELAPPFSSVSYDILYTFPSPRSSIRELSQSFPGGCHLSFLSLFSVLCFLSYFVFARLHLLSCVHPVAESKQKKDKDTPFFLLLTLPTLLD
ncbi:hypothetical protein LX36DRAFT_40206 [Colletotrichum falcatum]|nr:hypothetical protein LX36DRAFT_40206 [Colletotrichum falcatum]